MLPSQNIFIVQRFANTFKGHVSCSQELEDCEQKRVNINSLYPFYNLAFSFTYYFISPFIPPVLWVDGHLGLNSPGGAWDHETSSRIFEAN